MSTIETTMNKRGLSRHVTKQIPTSLPVLDCLHYNSLRLKEIMRYNSLIVPEIRKEREGTPN